MDPATGTPSKVGNPLANTDFHPTWVRHLASHDFVAGDAVSLARASAAYVKEGRSWRASYWLPSSADLGIVALRRWMETHGGGPDIPTVPPSAAGHGVIARPTDTRGLTPTEAALDAAPVDVLLDRYNQHTKHCAPCRSALATTRAVAAGARGLALAAALAASVFGAAATQAALAGAAAGGWIQQAALAVVSVTRGAPLAVVVGCMVVSAAAAAVASQARNLERKFYYEPFDREKHRFV